MMSLTNIGYVILTPKVWEVTRGHWRSNRGQSWNMHPETQCYLCSKCIFMDLYVYDCVALYMALNVCVECCECVCLYVWVCMFVYGVWWLYCTMQHRRHVVLALEFLVMMLLTWWLYIAATATYQNQSSHCTIQHLTE